MQLKAVTVLIEWRWYYYTNVCYTALPCIYMLQAQLFSILYLSPYHIQRPIFHPFIHTYAHIYEWNIGTTYYIHIHTYTHVHSLVHNYMHINKQTKIYCLYFATWPYGDAVAYLSKYTALISSTTTGFSSCGKLFHGT